MPINDYDLGVQFPEANSPHGFRHDEVQRCYAEPQGPRDHDWQALARPVGKHQRYEQDHVVQEAGHPSRRDYVTPVGTHKGLYIGRVTTWVNARCHPPPLPDRSTSVEHRG